MPDGHSPIVDLASLGLTAEQKAMRATSFGGSDANTLMTGNPDYIRQLWEEKCGLRKPDDLSRELRVQLGQYTEAFNRAWFCREAGGDARVIMDGQEVRHKLWSWRHATLDGIVKGLRLLEGEDAIFEAKHVSGKKSFDDVLAYYMPQLQHNMACASLEFAVFSVILGTESYRFTVVPFDATYHTDLLAREKAFMQSVWDRTPPELPEIPQEPQPTRVINYEAEGNNQFADLAAQFLEKEEAAKQFEKAKRSLKEMTPDDAAEVHGYGVTIKRTKSNSLTIKKTK